MGKTLWEMFMGLFYSPQKSRQVFNPLGVEVGKFVWLDSLDYRDQQFRVGKINEYTRDIGGKVFRFTDYHLSNTDGSKNFVLRYNPMDKPLPGVEQKSNVLLMTLYDEVSYSDDFLGVLNAETKMFEVNLDGVVAERYWRINDVQDPYVAKVVSVEKLAHDLTSTEELASHELKYWDYWREVEDEAKFKVLEFMFIEMDTSNGWFQLWKGKEIDPYLVRSV